MKLAIFFSDGLIGNVTISKLVPQIIAMGIEPVLIKGNGPAVKRAKIPELHSLSFLETSLLTNVVEPFFVRKNSSEHAECTTISGLAEKYNLELLETDDVNSPEFAEMLFNEKKIMHGVSIRFYPKFGKEIIDRFRECGFLWNLHTGLLPKYKGVFIPYRAIENNDTHYGWTLHNVNYEIDCGSIIALDKLPLNKQKPVLNTYLNMCEKGAAMIMGALMFFQKRGTIPSQKQTTYFDSYYTFPTAQEMQQWQAKGVIFSHDIIETYTSLFTSKGSTGEKQLRAELEKAIDQHALKRKAA